MVFSLSRHGFLAFLVGFPFLPPQRPNEEADGPNEGVVVKLTTSSGKARSVGAGAAVNPKGFVGFG